MGEDDNVYFVEEIFSEFDKNEKEIINYSVVLLRTTMEDDERDDINESDFILATVNTEQIENIREGQYLIYNQSQESNLQFINANQNPIAKRNVIKNNFYRGKLLRRASIDNANPNIDVDAKIHTYHVNVGHGNCSVIVIDEKVSVKIWMVDCSNYDFLSRVNYNNNIDLCFAHIITKFNLSNIFIEKFFLTHTHFDHYSGIQQLINQNKITSETQFYINMHYAMPSKKYTSLLKSITALNCPIIEPIVASSTIGIEFWHPHLRTIRTNTPTYFGQIVNVESKPNNSSTVFQLSFGDKSILFTGDIETQGWHSITNCPAYLNDTNYFIVSHHGSLNGHIRTLCPVHITITNLSDCINNSSTSSIVMGRHGAFSGIYSSRVISDLGASLIYSEKDNLGRLASFLEIEWATNIKSWY